VAKNPGLDYPKAQGARGPVYFGAPYGTEGFLPVAACGRRDQTICGLPQSADSARTSMPSGIPHWAQPQTWPVSPAYWSRGNELLVARDSGASPDTSLSRPETGRKQTESGPRPRHGPAWFSCWHHAV